MTDCNFKLITEIFITNNENKFLSFLLHILRDIRYKRKTDQMTELLTPQPELQSKYYPHQAQVWTSTRLFSPDSRNCCKVLRDLEKPTKYEEIF